jgi:hypothetical protein
LFKDTPRAKLVETVREALKALEDYEAVTAPPEIA